MKFESFTYWKKALFESQEERFGCVMLLANLPNWKEHLKIISKEDIYDDAEHNYGYSDEPHITVLYGIHHEKVDIKEIFETIQHMHPVSTKVYEIDIFENPEYDVVIYKVPVTNDLKEYREMFMSFPNTQTYDEYKPHMTLAYVKKGQGKKYIKPIKPFKVNFNTAFYSSPEYEKKYFKLS